MRRSVNLVFRSTIMSTNELLGQIYFTEYDKDVTGSANRDPLGLQPIWQHYGNQVIKHLTGQSNDLRGFREVLLCLSICNDCLNDCLKEPRFKNRFDLQELILLFEQLFIYSTITEGDSDGILGNENGTRKYKDNNEDPFVSYDPEKTILSKEYSLGYYGRYKNPLISMGLINDKSVPIDVKSQNDFIDDVTYENIYKSFSGFLNKVDEKAMGASFKKFKGAEELYDAVCGDLRPGEKDFWKKWFQIGDYNADALMKNCYEIVSKENAGMEAVNSLLGMGLKDEDKRRLEDLKSTERFLLCIEYVFYKALNSTDLKSVLHGMTPEEYKEHVNRYNDFRNVKLPKEKTYAGDRMRMIQDRCKPDPENRVKYVKGILDYHNEIRKQTGKALWVEYNEKNESIQAEVLSDTKININESVRDYYFRSLLSIKQSLGKGSDHNGLQ